MQFTQWQIPVMVVERIVGYPLSETRHLKITIRLVVAALEIRIDSNLSSIFSRLSCKAYLRSERAVRVAKASGISSQIPPNWI